MENLPKKIIAASARAWPYFLITALMAGLFREAIFPPFPAFVLSRESGDVSTLYYYWRSFGFGTLRSGVIPLWNPAVFSGVPFAAYPETALFYPLNLIFLFLSLPAALNFSFAFHLWLLAVFTYIWLRFTGSGRIPSLLGGLVLACSGPVILHLTAGHLSNICTFAWVPLTFLLAEGFFRTRRPRWAAGTGALIALQLLAGHWQYVYYTILGLIVYLVGRALLEPRREGKGLLLLPAGAVLAGLAALALAAVQVLPALELAGDSFRGEPGPEWGAAFSLPPANLATFVLPGWLGDSLTSLYRGEYYFWEMCAYLGFIPLVLAAGAVIFLKDRFTPLLALLAGLAVLAALGDSTPLFRVLRGGLPGFRYFRGHAKLLFFAAFFLASLAARGADGLFGRRRHGPPPERRGTDRFRRRLTGTGAAVLLLVGAAGLAVSAFAGNEPPAWWRERIQTDLLHGRHYEIVPPGRPDWWERLVQQTPPDLDYPGYVRRLVSETPFPLNSWRTFRDGLRRLGLTAAVLGLLLAALIRFPRLRKWWAAAACLLAAGEAALWAAPYVTGFDSRVCLWDGETAAFFESREEPFRYLPFDPADFNRGMAGGYDSILGYQADVPRRYLEYMGRSQGLPAGVPELLPAVTAYTPLLDLLNTRYLLLPPGAAPETDVFTEVLNTPGGVILANPRAFPRALVSSRARRLGRPEEVLSALARDGYRPEAEVYLEEVFPERFREGSGESPGRARVISQEVNRVWVEAELDRPGVLLLNDSYRPGWRAYLRGEEVPVYRANYLMRAILLERGSHLVEFRYRPASFAIGAAVSLAALLALGIGFALPAAGKRKSRSAGNSPRRGEL